METTTQTSLKSVMMENGADRRLAMLQSDGKFDNSQ